MTISELINENASVIESCLKNYLDVNDSDYQILYDAMRYGVLEGGKRIRPLLAMEFCRNYGGDVKRVIPFACALEMIHCYSLIHDDLPCMDNDEYRRGKLTVHKAYGEANALLAGDALLTLAFEIASENEECGYQQCAMAVSELALAAGASGMVGGQVMDLIGEKEKLSLENLVKMNRLKTGRLIRCACRLGCIAAGEYDFAECDQYSDGIGLTYQIIDDILDDGTEDNKSTFMTYYSKEDAMKLAAELTEDAKSQVKNENLINFADYLLNRKK